MMAMSRHAFCVHCLVLLAAGMTGCASQSPVASELPPVPVGTVLTYSRIQTGSYGSDQGNVVWTYGEATWEGQRVLDARNNIGGGTYHDPRTFGIVAALNGAGQPMMSFSPPLAPELPLVVGKSWTSRHVVTLHPFGKKMPFDSTWKVEAFEDVTVPAGKFSAYRVVRSGSDGETETRWISLQPGGVLIKRMLDRGADHRQGLGHMEASLVAYQLGRP